MAQAQRDQAAGVRLEAIDTAAYQIPTEQPESDGTLAWDSVTIVVVHAWAGGRWGLGYTYGDRSLAELVNAKLAGAVRGMPAFDIPAIRRSLYEQIRNLGRPGLCAEAISAIDVALWDLKARLLDLEGLRLLRDRAPAGMDIAAGEYAFDLFTVQRMLDAGAVDVIQPDATRCGGVTGFLKAATLAATKGVGVSAHCAPSLHAHAGCAAADLRHIEYFHDHVRIEHLLFDGVLEPRHGTLRPDLGRPGLGLELKRADAERYAVA